MKITRRLWLTCCLLVLVGAEDAEYSEEETVPRFEPGLFELPNLDLSDVYLAEMFQFAKLDDSNWKKSKARKDGLEESLAMYSGEWLIGSPSRIVLQGDSGLIVGSKARHHAIATALSKPVTFDKDSLIVQYEVKYEDGQECGGGYVKLLSEGAEKDISAFNDKTDYTIMFGPDKCGPQSKIHFIIKIKNPKNGSISEHHAPQPKDIPDFTDKKTHLFTLKLQKNNDYEVLLDNKRVYSGNMLKDLVPSVQPPTQIADPEDKKPADWDDVEFIFDPEATKPDDWDESAPKEVEDVDAVKPSDWLEDEKLLIPDPNAEKPEDWDDDMDGEFEPRMIQNPLCKDRSGCGEWRKPMKPNPVYKGKWNAPKIANPNFKGRWAAKLIDNPHFFEVNPYQNLVTITALGFELWTMDQNIIFDNILITEDPELSLQFAAQTFQVKRDLEQMLEQIEAPSRSYFQSIIDATQDRPWLWVVYILCILIPIIAISAYFFGRKSGPEADFKKTDDFQPDDEEDEEPEEGHIEDVSDNDTPSTSQKSRKRSDSHKSD